MLERFFRLNENHTTVRTEVLAGVTTFLTMAVRKVRGDRQGLCAAAPRRSTGFVPFKTAPRF